MPKFYLGCQAVLSLFATGKTTGTVLDSGEGVTHTVPIFEGYAIPHAITPIPICGANLTKYMLDLIKKKESPSGSDRDLFLMAENFKCLYGEVALDYDAQLKQARDTNEPETYVLPSGTKLVRSYREERLMCPEQLF